MISRERPHRPFLSRRDREFVHEPICGADDELVGDLEQSNVNSRVAGSERRFLQICGAIERLNDEPLLPRNLFGERYLRLTRDISGFQAARFLTGPKNSV